ncbi:MAG: hypothetical protein QM571_02900 [Micrococcaceae bacterium]
MKVTEVLPVGMELVEVKEDENLEVLDISKNSDGTTTVVFNVPTLDIGVTEFNIPMRVKPLDDGNGLDQKSVLGAKQLVLARYGDILAVSNMTNSEVVKAVTVSVVHALKSFGFGNVARQIEAHIDNSQELIAGLKFPKLSGAPNILVLNGDGVITLQAYINNEASFSALSMCMERLLVSLEADEISRQVGDCVLILGQRQVLEFGSEDDSYYLVEQRYGEALLTPENVGRVN